MVSPPHRCGLARWIGSSQQLVNRRKTAARHAAIGVVCDASVALHELMSAASPAYEEKIERCLTSSSWLLTQSSQASAYWKYALFRGSDYVLDDFFAKLWSSAQTPRKCVVFLGDKDRLVTAIIAPARARASGRMLTVCTRIGVPSGSKRCDKQDESNCGLRETWLAS